MWGPCLPFVVATLATGARIRGTVVHEGRVQHVLPTTQSVSATCLRETGGRCMWMSRFDERGDTECVDGKYLCVVGSCSNSSGVCTKVSGRHLGTFAIRSLTAGFGSVSMPKYLGAELGVKPFGHSDPAFLSSEPTWYAAIVDDPAPQWLVTDIGDGFLRFENTHAQMPLGLLPSMDGMGIQPWHSPHVGALQTGFMVREGPLGSYEMVHYFGTPSLRMNSWRLFPRFRSRGEALRVWIAIFTLWCFLVLGCSSAAGAEFGMAVCCLIPLFLFFVGCWNPDYGVASCGGRYGACLDRQWVRFEPPLDPMMVARREGTKQLHPVYMPLTEEHILFVLVSLTGLSVQIFGCLSAHSTDEHANKKINIERVAAMDASTTDQAAAPSAAEATDPAAASEATAATSALRDSEAGAVQPT